MGRRRKRRCASGFAGLLVVLVAATASTGASGSTPVHASPRFLVSVWSPPPPTSAKSTPSRIEILDARGAVIRVISRATFLGAPARWSPDGSQLAWTDEAGLSVERADGTG